MIELKKLDEVQRCVIGSQCKRFFLTFNRLKCCKSVFDTISKDLQLTKAHDKEIWTVINCAGKILKSGLIGSEFSLSPSVYRKANESHDLKLSHIRASKVIKLLDELGYLTFYKGYGTSKEGSSNWMRSCIVLNTKFTNLFTTGMVKRFKDEYTPTEFVEIRDSKTGKCILKYVKIKGISVIRNLVENYNELLSRNNITLLGNKCSVVYKQIFHDNIESGGRFYTFGKFQVTKSGLRKLIKINGRDTTEVDLSNLHCSLLRVLQGLPPVGTFFDQYDIVGYERHMCKAGMMCMINCKTRRGAGKALYNISNDSEWHLTEDQCHDIVTKLEERNSPIIFFGKGSSDWKVLQRLDSSLCEYVIAQFIKIDRVVLCYHDSWLVEKELQDYLIKIIRDAWRYVMKVDYDCKVKIEF